MRKRGRCVLLHFSVPAEFLLLWELYGIDRTDIFDRAGGQKHRIALARACYADADVYLLDDPLSAVDVHVGRHIMGHCICDLLASKTRILVTHQLQYMPEADLVVKMEGGTVKHAGPYHQLVAEGVSFASFKLETQEGDGAAEVPEPGEDEAVNGKENTPAAVNDSSPVKTSTVCRFGISGCA
jgi:ABC-type sulfate/molybdate transport systems ATPase subunit